MAILTTAKFSGARLPRGRTTSALGSVCALAFVLCGCITLPVTVFKPPPVNLTSPIAKDIEVASVAKGAYPKFINVPPTAPADIRPGSAWSNNIYDTLNLRREQQALAALYPQTLFDTEGFAGANRAKAAPPPPPGQSAQTEDYAKTQRERATPPSPTQ